MRLGLEKLTDDSVAARNFNKIQEQWIKGPAQARVFNSANLTATTAVNKIATFNSERYDFGDFHSTSVNPSRLTAPTDGLYLIGANIRWTANATGFRQLAFNLNAATPLASVIQPAISGVVIDQHLSTVYHLTAGNYVELSAFQNSGGNLDIIAQGNFSPEFWIVRLGSQG